MRRTLQATIERFPIAGSFTISRGSRTEAVVVSVRVTEDGAAGHGECVPYPRYGETPENVVDLVEGIRGAVEDGADRAALQELLPAGAARNAVDCAFWDLEAKRSGKPVHVLANLPEPAPLTTAYTISLGSPESMADMTAKAAHRPLLKIKLGGDGDGERMLAVREAAPGARLILDANEAWSAGDLECYIEIAAGIGAEVIEQPLPAGRDAVLGSIERIVPVCADESMHTRQGLASLRDRYDAINIKLDKTGGLTEALSVQEEAISLGFRIMAGCMVGTSLAMAPAILIGQRAEWVDLDGPLLLARDREPGLHYAGSTVFPPQAALWG